VRAGFACLSYRTFVCLLETVIVIMRYDLESFVAVSSILNQRLLTPLALFHALGDCDGCCQGKSIQPWKQSGIFPIEAAADLASKKVRGSAFRS
jgi:hypothetical protein